MLKITYTHETDMNIILDGEFIIHYGYDCIENAVEKARLTIGKYGFTHAEIVDNENDESLAVIDVA